MDARERLTALLLREDDPTPELVGLLRKFAERPESVGSRAHGDYVEGADLLRALIQRLDLQINTGALARSLRLLVGEVVAKTAGRGAVPLPVVTRLIRMVVAAEPSLIKDLLPLLDRHAEDPTPKGGDLAKVVLGAIEETRLELPAGSWRRLIRSRWLGPTAADSYARLGGWPALRNIIEWLQDGFLSLDPADLRPIVVATLERWGQPPVDVGNTLAAVEGVAAILAAVRPMEFGSQSPELPEESLRDELAYFEEGAVQDADRLEVTV